MPFPRSWVEELVVEYYMLRGFTVNFDVPAGSGRRGGRRDIDVIAVNPSTREVHIVDVTNIWQSKSENVVEKIVERLRRAEELVSEWYGEGFRIVKKAVLLGEPRRSGMTEIVEALRKEGIDACSLADLIVEIIDYIEKWRSEAKQRRLVSKDTKPMLPEMLPMLKLLEYMKDSNMIKSGR